MRSKFPPGPETKKRSGGKCLFQVDSKTLITRSEDSMGWTADRYHQETSYDRAKMEGHYLDWQNQPSVFKTYKGLETVSLPRDTALPDRDFFSLYSGAPGSNRNEDVCDLETLSRILLLTCTITRKARQPGGNFYFRSAASAGALYPTEIYLHSSGLTGLDDGLYHFSIRDHGLVKLRDGNFGDAIDRSTVAPQSKGWPLTIFLTAIFLEAPGNTGNVRTATICWTPGTCWLISSCLLRL
jgi:hypothetical protein